MKQSQRTRLSPPPHLRNNYRGEAETLHRSVQLKTDKGLHSHHHKLYNPVQEGYVAVEMNAGAMVKYLCLPVVISMLLLSSACALISDSPRHAVDEVISIARSFSPDCWAEVAPQSEPCG